MKNSIINVLDCTLRDGGYYNNWEFESDVVERYLRSMQAASVDVIEIGFRSFPKPSFMGPYAYCTDEFLIKLGLPSNLKIGVMINCNEILFSDDEQEDIVRGLFRKADDSLIKLVRVAIDFNHALEAKFIVCALKELGYQVALNLMQAHNKKMDDYSDLAAKIESWDAIDVLYFADSLGNMTPKKVEMVCRSIKMGWNGPIGIHTHNNKNLALINTIIGIENGVSWCDSTIAGMGRGAGNTPTENLLMELNLNDRHSGDATLLQESVEDFNRYKKIYNWGSNIYYHFASNHDIHPTFVQTLLSDRRYSKPQIFEILKNMAKKETYLLSGQPIDPSDYSIDALNAVINTLNGVSNISTGTWDATGWLANREVLIIGAGPSVKRYKKDIIKYVEMHNPAVLELNINNLIPRTLVTASIVSLEARAIFDGFEYEKLKHPIILPMGRVGNFIGESIDKSKLFDYGLVVEAGTFEFKPTGCRLHFPYTACYALAVANQAGANNISLIGFDGYSSVQSRQIEMNKIFDLYNKNNNVVPIVSLSPTNYLLDQRSIFSLK